MNSIEKAVKFISNLPSIKIDLRPNSNESTVSGANTDGLPYWSGVDPPGLLPVDIEAYTIMSSFKLCWIASLNVSAVSLPVVLKAAFESSTVPPNVYRSYTGLYT